MARLMVLAERTGTPMRQRAERETTHAGSVEGTWAAWRSHFPNTAVPKVSAASACMPGRTC